MSSLGLDRAKGDLNPVTVSIGSASQGARRNRVCSSSNRPFPGGMNSGSPDGDTWIAVRAIDHMTVLSSSNYLPLRRYREHHISREWTMDGALVELIEKHVFEGRGSATAYANKLDTRGVVLDGQPVIKPEEITAIRNKRTRCDHAPESMSGEWRTCALVKKQGPDGDTKIAVRAPSTPPQNAGAIT